MDAGSTWTVLVIVVAILLVLGSSTLVGAVMVRRLARSSYERALVILRRSLAPAPHVTDPGLRGKSARLTSMLRETSRLMTEIERDVEGAQARADELQGKIDRNADLASLTEAQANAVRLAMGATLNQVVAESDRRSFWQQLVVQLVLGAIFFALGVVATLLLG